MIKYSKSILSLALILSFSGLAQAENDRRGPPERPSFDSLDINGNAEIDFDEFSSHEIPHGDYETIFNRIDTDGDGIITNEEFDNHKPPQRQKRQEGQR